MMLDQGVVACYLLSETGLWSRTTPQVPPSTTRVSFLAMLLPLRTSEVRTEADGEITGKTWRDCGADYPGERERCMRQ